MVLLSITMLFDNHDNWSCSVYYQNHNEHSPSPPWICCPNWRHCCLCWQCTSVRIYFELIASVKCFKVQNKYTFLPIAPLAFRGGGGSKILCCCCGGNVEYSGMILMSPTSGPRSSTSRLIRLHASSISCRGKHLFLRQLNQILSCDFDDTFRRLQTKSGDVRLSDVLCFWSCVRSCGFKHQKSDCIYVPPQSINSKTGLLCLWVQY